MHAKKLFFLPNGSSLERIAGWWWRPEEWKPDASVRQSAGRGVEREFEQGSSSGSIHNRAGIPSKCCAWHTPASTPPAPLPSPAPA